MSLPLDDIALILGCSKPAASLLRRGKYGDVAKESDLPKRYARLAEIVEAAKTIDPAALCAACPRQDCAGCRIAEI